MIHLVDGTAQLYRWLAGPTFAPQTDAVLTGLVKAAFGMHGYLKEHRPDRVVFVFDCDKSKLIKRKKYPYYKAKRRKHARESMRHMVPVAKRLTKVCNELGVATWMQDGYEGDDLLASLTKKFSKDKHYAKHGPVHVVTGDKDLMQLVNGTRVLWQNFKGRNWGALDAAGVEKQVGLPPEQMRDYLALCGDPVDDIPGIAGVGDVHARALLGLYGSIDAMLKADTRTGLVGLVRDAHASGILQEQLELVTLLTPKPCVKFRDTSYTIPSVGQIKEALRKQEVRI